MILIFMQQKKSLNQRFKYMKLIRFYDPMNMFRKITTALRYIWNETATDLLS